VVPLDLKIINPKMKKEGPYTFCDNIEEATNAETLEYFVFSDPFHTPSDWIQSGESQGCESGMAAIYGGAVARTGDFYQTHSTGF
jgi:hypothetical protein